MMSTKAYLEYCGQQQCRDTIAELIAERRKAVAALEALYDAIPTGFGEDRALNEATKQAEKVLGISR